MYIYTDKPSLSNVTYDDKKIICIMGGSLSKNQIELKMYILN